MSVAHAKFCKLLLAGYSLVSFGLAMASVPCLGMAATMPGTIDEQCGSRISAKEVFLDDGRIRLEAINKSHISVTALLAVGRRAIIGSRMLLTSSKYFDSVLDPYRDEAIAPGGEHVFAFFGPHPPVSRLRIRTVELKAAIFADGSICGEPSASKVLIDRRRSAYRYESEAFQILMDEKFRSTRPERIIDRLAKLERNELVNTHDIAERQLASSIFAEVTMLIHHSSASSQPDYLSLGAAFGPTSKGILDAAIKRLTRRIGELKSSQPAVTM